MKVSTMDSYRIDQFLALPGKILGTLILPMSSSHMNKKDSMKDMTMWLDQRVRNRQRGQDNPT